jgi:hypothetical protein
VEKVGFRTSTRSSALDQVQAMTVHFALSGMLSRGQQSSIFEYQLVGQKRLIKIDQIAIQK